MNDPVKDLNRLPLAEMAVRLARLKDSVNAATGLSAQDKLALLGLVGHFATLARGAVDWIDSMKAELENHQASPMAKSLLMQELDEYLLLPPPQRERSKDRLHQGILPRPEQPKKAKETRRVERVSGLSFPFPAGYEDDSPQEPGVVRAP